MRAKAPDVDPLARLAAQGAMIEQLSSDSRRSAPGVAFFAYPGAARDGRAFIGEAIGRGAAAVLWEEEGFRWRPEWRAPNAPVAGLKHRAGELAHAFYGRPSESLWVCGVTGTNGKTTCTQWLAALLERAGRKSAVVGTLGFGRYGHYQETANTTPDALELHRMLADFRREGARCVAMEVSSHGLEQGRVNGVRFACALFTNLSHDHLDYHGTMAAYAEAKSRLFEAEGLGAAVLNLDDPLGARLAPRLRARGVRTIGYGAGARASAPVDDYLAASLVPSARAGELGPFNLANALGVLGCLVAYGLALDDAVGMLDSLPEVPGRMQRIGERPLVVVDYAHTPDALEKVLGALRPLSAARGGRLAVVFGAGGDRDREKRPLMGAVATRLADKVLLTSDNPRGEEPLEIIRQIRAGAGGGEVEPDRGRAIERMVLESAPGDVILIAGKGHERFQEIAGRRIPFSDADAARAALRRRGAR